MSEVKGTTPDELGVLYELQRQVEGLEAGAARQGAVHSLGDAADPIAPTFNANWRNDELNGTQSPAAFYRDPAGTVFMRGRIRLTVAVPTAAVAAFTLPVGFRPIADSYFAQFAAQNGAALFMYVLVRTSGVVEVGALTVGATLNYVSLDGIAFRVF